MNSIILTNKTFLQFLVYLIAQYGLPWIIGLGVLIFTLIIIYKVLKRKGLIDNSTSSKVDFSPMLEKLSEINTTLKSNGKILDLIVERQEGHLKEEHALCVINFILDSLVNEILRKVMEIYRNNNISKNEIIIKQALISELESMIKEYHREADLLPNIIYYTKPIKEQLSKVEETCEKIVIIMKTEPFHEDACRKFKSIITTALRDSWLK